MMTDYADHNDPLMRNQDPLHSEMIEVLAVLTLAELQRFVFAPRYHDHQATFSVFAIVAISSYDSYSAQQDFVGVSILKLLAALM